MVEWVRYNARTNVFAKALPLVYVRTVDSGPVHRGIRARSSASGCGSIARRLQAGLADLGFDIGDTESPITPVYVIAGDEKTAMSMISDAARGATACSSPPSPIPLCPRGVILFRMIPTAAHTEEDVDRTVEAFRRMRDAMKLDLSTKPSQQNR